MTVSGNSSKKKGGAARGSQKKIKSSAATKPKAVKDKEPNTKPVDFKDLEEHRKNIHAAAKEAQNAVKKALEGMSDLTKYEEKYEE